MIRNPWMKFGGAAIAAALLVTAGVAVAHANGMFRGQALTYEGEPGSGELTNVSRNGTTLFESISYDAEDIVAHRGPGFGLRALNATTVTLVVPEDATIVVHEAVEDWSPAGATITYANGEKVNLRVKNGTLAVDGDTLTLELEADGGAHVGPVGKLRFAMGGPGGHGLRGGARGHR